MGGSSIVGEEWELASQASSISTMVLLGKTGNGKSATGNTILDKKAFGSASSAAGVTLTCEKHSTILNDGHTLTVIDTPGVFDSSFVSESVTKEIIRCMDLAKDGIHAVLVVLSVRTRFSKDEEAAIKLFQKIFGDKITDYMIVVFTGGDVLAEDGITLNDYIGQNCPKELQNILQLCKYRAVLFDNKTKLVTKRAEQVHELLSLVDLVVAANGGQPFSDQFLADLKDGALRLHDKEVEVESLKEIPGCTEERISDLKMQIQKAYEDQLAQMTATVSQKMQESVERLERQLANEQAVRKQALKQALRDAKEKKKSSLEMRELRAALERAQILLQESVERLERQLANEQAVQKQALKDAKEKKKSSLEMRELRAALERAQMESNDLRRRVEEGKCAFL